MMMKSSSSSFQLKQRPQYPSLTPGDSLLEGSSRLIKWPASEQASQLATQSAS